ncbi:MAG: imidazole glycerol phosphate synthase, glutamine amidotransferase subunit [Candidatus Jacksonbacteria bacterium RIFOXYC2_FULL_44_29]|nr:MAG: Imidazole glycerol phosphate synthase subunit HisH [Parcubacteria group bacterium GW2011_GWA2_42_28]KKT54706.1 MAG: Imidazole glycerol phosphate synthase subunit HisH [Parcubacteria group bacterium GW2011_GWC2_44_22]OGY75305.1 MAG: imidazole glycerol phosphate synthase, glutamine amidotransferase subunit [Candidatus Jacksonbacteria bacterium RIFOXYA2_FULL_43_12]OGY76215.1 MAG: imidazole glycerol phosphate synthase, glutamine amidotransferase subunit [Candidatus Jacksonbacteria bacterium 
MLTIIDYGASNLKSLTNALDAIKAPYTISNKRDVIKKADKIILPGVGSANFAMAQLKKLKLIDVIRELKVPALGICLGMQILFDYSEEGNTQCLGIIKGQVKKITSPNLKVPHIGWNTVKKQVTRNKKQTDDYFYFVHSYYCIPQDKTSIVALTDYSGEFCSIVRQNHFYGTQFHPEKSGEAGLKILKSFCSL